MELKDKVIVDKDKIKQLLNQFPEFDILPKIHPDKPLYWLAGEWNEQVKKWLEKLERELLHDTERR